MAGRTAQVGAGHLETLQAKASQAGLLDETARTIEEQEQARKLYEEVSAGQKLQLGGGHPHTLTTNENLARLLAKMGEWAEARRLLQVIQWHPAATHVDAPGTCCNSKLIAT